MKTKALKIVGIVIVGLVALIAIVAAFLSPKSHVERSIVINAQPAAIFQEINSFKNFKKWSPWAEIDPNAKYSFEGPETGVGAKMSWTSENDNVGNGAQWIIESVQDKHLKTGLQFGDMAGTYTSDINLEPAEGGTKVTWTYDGDVSEVGMTSAAMYKVVGMFMDGMIGPDYEKGLNKLKSVAESQPKTESPAPADSTKTTK